MDYPKMMMRSGWTPEAAMAMNNLWLACGLKHIDVLGHRLVLREPEAA